MANLDFLSCVMNFKERLHIKLLIKFGLKKSGNYEVFVAQLIQRCISKDGVFTSLITNGTKNVVRKNS